MSVSKTTVRRKCLLYPRVSTDEQAKEGYSLESQLEALRAHCHYKKWDIIGEYGDDGKTARTLKRDGLQYNLMLLREGDADTLLVLYLDRLARNLRDLLYLFELSEVQGWTIVILDLMGDTVDSRSASGKLMISVLGAVAQFTSDLTSEKTKEGMVKARANGKVFGDPARINGELGVRIVKLYRQGFGATEIARILNGEGVPTIRRSSEWRSAVIRDYLVRTLGDKYVSKWHWRSKGLERVNKVVPLS